MGVIGKRKAPWTVESLSRKIAFWHGQKKVVGGETLAARHGYGSWGRSPMDYASAHWQEYTTAAEMVLSDLRK